jgi:pimeloyl-ACP methyl ester carboxylesterase
MTHRFALLRRLCLAAAGAFMLAGLPAAPAAAASAEVVTLTVRGDARQRFLIVRPDGPPKAIVVLYSGGNGNLKIGADGSIENAGNFLVRSRDLFAAEGFLVAVVDRPSDWAGSDKDRFRVVAAHAEDAAAIARRLRQEAPVPLWFVGTSRGSVSVANIASRLGGNSLGGIVLTSSVASPGKRGLPAVPDVDVSGVAVPVLILGHGGDDCYVTLWPEQEALAELFKGAASVETFRVDGGDAGNHADPCGPYSHHGVLGQEKAVVGRIATWIRGHLK